MQPVPKQGSQNLQISLSLCKKTELIENRVPGPLPVPIYILSMASMVSSISVGQLGLAAWLCSLPASAHQPNLGNCKKASISQQQLKPSVYYQHSSHTKSKTQEVLGRKLTLSQPKPGHSLTCTIIIWWLKSLVKLVQIEQWTSCTISYTKYA